MREIRTSGSMRGCRRRAARQRACALLYRAPALPPPKTRNPPFYYATACGDFVRFTPPEGREGMLLVAVDTNPSADVKRMYVLPNAAWTYVDVRE